MQNVRFCMLSVVLIVCSCTTDELNCYPDEVRDNILAAYTFTDGSLNDISPNARHLDFAIGAIPTKGRGGEENCAYEFKYDFPSVHKLIREDAGFLDNLPSFSVSTWYKIDGGSLNSQLKVLVARDSINACPNRGGQWSLGIYDCQRGVFGHVNSAWTSDEWCSMPADTMSWINLLAVKGVDTLSIYLNGVLQEEVIGTGNCNWNIQSKPQDMGALVIGRRLSGAIDDVTIFDRKLTEEEAMLLFLEEP